jgi:hypothetical protein
MLTTWEFRLRLALANWGGDGIVRGVCGQIVGINDANGSWGCNLAGASKQFGAQIEKAGGTGTQVFQANAVPGGWVDGDGIARWIRFTYTPGSPAQGAWYNSTDGVAWTAMGTPSSSTVNTLIDSTRPILVGNFDTTLWPGISGYMTRFEFRSPIGGAIVLGFDATQQTPGALTMRGLAGETWTLNGAAVLI